MSDLPKPKEENRLPDCVALKLGFQHVLQEEAGNWVEKLIPGKNVQTEENQVEIKLTINFGKEQEITVPTTNSKFFPNGKIKFGLSGGILHLELENGKIPLDKVLLANELSLTFEYQVEEEQSTEKQSGVSLSSDISIGKEDPNAVVKGGLNAGSKKANKNVKKSKQIQSRVHMTGCDNRYQWEFKLVGSEQFLEGLLRNQPIGTLVVDEKPCQALVKFTSEQENIRISKGEMGWTKDISANQWAVIERKIAKDFIASCLKPYISQVRWSYD